MIDRAHELPIQQQAKRLEISRSGVYDSPRPVSAANLTLVRSIPPVNTPGKALSITHKFSPQDDAELNINKAC